MKCVRWSTPPPTLDAHPDRARATCYRPPCVMSIPRACDDDVRFNMSHHLVPNRRDRRDDMEGAPDAPHNTQHTHAFTHTHVHKHTRTHAQTHAHTHTHRHKHTQTHTHTHTHTHSHTHTHTYTHTHTHTEADRT